VADIPLSSHDLNGAGQLSGLILVEGKFARENSDILQRIINVQHKAAAWASNPQNKDAFIQLLANQSGYPQETLRAEWDGLPPLSWRLSPDLDPQFVTQLTHAIDIARQTKLIRQPVDVQQWLDNSFLKQIKKTGTIIMGNKWHYSLITASILAGLSAAQATETPVTAASHAVTDNTVQLKKVKVRASRPQVRQQTTLSTRVDGKTLEQDRLYRFEDIAQEVSGVDIAATDALDTRITIRGIGDGGGSEINIGMPSSVGQFLDGVRLSRPGMLSNDLLDIDSVNVLKGPQGTLYGFNTSAGAIDIRTRKPTFAPEYSLEQSVGQRGYVQSKLMASGALTDTLAGRINLSHTEKGGYVDNVLTGNKLSGNRSNGVRGQLLWQPTDNLDMRFIGDYSESHQLW
jgi:hypothetical protein